MPDWLQAIDWTALHWIRDTLHCGFLDLLMPAITALGNGGIIWLIAAAALSVSKKYRKYGIVLFAALAAGAHRHTDQHRCNVPDESMDPGAKRDRRARRICRFVRAKRPDGVNGTARLFS